MFWSLCGGHTSTGKNIRPAQESNLRHELGPCVRPSLIDPEPARHIFHSWEAMGRCGQIRSNLLVPVGSQGGVGLTVRR